MLSSATSAIALANGGSDYVTSYTYDVFNHLTQVAMTRGSNTQYRPFNYDITTRRLMSAANPENGTVSYTYYATSFYYDSYDAYGQKLEGRLAAVTYTSSEGIALMERFSYTQAGLPIAKRLDWSEAPYLIAGYMQAQIAYDSEGRRTSLTPPSGTTYFYTYDSMGRNYAIRINDPFNPNNYVVSSASYGPAGELLNIYSRNNPESRTYNSRLQLTSISASFGLNVTYSYGAAGQNNGQIVSMTDNNTGEQVVYQYDSLKRLISAATSGDQWGLSFSYDGFGNKTAQTLTKWGGGSGVQQPTSGSQMIDPTTNRIAGSRASTHFRISAGITCEASGSKLSRGPYRL